MKEKKGAFSRILKRTKPENKIFVDLGLDISEQVRFIIANHPTLKSQKAIATALGKEESEISKWLSGLHNLTLESLSKLTAVLGQDIIMTDLKAKEKYSTKGKNAVASYYATASNQISVINTGRNDYSRHGRRIVTDKIISTTHTAVNSSNLLN
jgi:transcriptional regulator with XRE-family HTH domain